MTETRCCIAGGGPAGMMLGLLLARAGVEVVVLEKHGDFLRDFRGDTLHPSTLDVMHELGLMDELLRRPHQKVRQVRVEIEGETLAAADFSHLPTQYQYIALMPQWDFLDLLADAAHRYPGFTLKMKSEAEALVEEQDRVVGVRGTGADGPFEIRAGLTVAADGRHSILRNRAGLEVKDLGAPIDVLWFRISRAEADPRQVLGRFGRGKGCILIDRGDYWQCGFVIRKGTFEGMRDLGLEAFRRDISELAPFLGDRVQELREWDDVKLLTVKVDRLRQWFRPGFLCIGDAAHAMSPIGGVGINLAIQDAVASANILSAALLGGDAPTEVLRQVQRRREWPTRLTQRLQVLAQKRVIEPVLAPDGPIRPPLPLRIMRRSPRLRRVLGRIIGLGFRPEHVRSPERVPGARIRQTQE